MYVVTDLHLAAELGKTLLDRNRELETLLKEKQTTIEDQKLEIEVIIKYISSFPNTIYKQVVPKLVIHFKSVYFRDNSQADFNRGDQAIYRAILYLYPGNGYTTNFVLAEI